MVEHIIKTVVDDRGLKQYVADLKEAEKNSRRFARNLSKDAKFLGASTKESFDKTGKAVLKTTGVFEDMGKKVSVSFKRTADGMEKVSQTSSNLTEKTKQTTKSLADMTKGFAKLAIRSVAVVPIWLAIRGAILGVINVTKDSIKFLIDWEYQMAQIRIVANESDETLGKLGSSLLGLSKALGVSNALLGEGAKLYAQQGRAISEIIPLMEATAKLSLLTGRTIVQSVEDMTAILKTYELEAKDAINIVDSITNVMLNHAITAGDLAEAYKQVSSTASTLGISLNALTGYITAIKTVTRDTGSKIGLTLRTVFSRISTASAEAIQSLTGIPLFLDKEGKAVTTATANLRNLETVIAELAVKFNELGTAEQAQLARLIGGVRRQNQVIALFRNFNEAIDANIDSLFALGKADNAISVLTDTMKLRIKRLEGAWGEFVNAVADTSALKTSVGALTEIIESFTATLNPKEFRRLTFLDEITKQQEKFVRENKLGEGFIQARARAIELADSVKEGRISVGEAEAEVLKWVVAINKAGRAVDFQINSNIKTASDLAQELEVNLNKIKEIQVTANINIARAQLNEQLVDVSDRIQRAFAETSKITQGVYYTLSTKKLIEEAKQLEYIFSNLDSKLGVAEAEFIKEAFQPRLDKEQYQLLTKLLNEHLNIGQQISNLEARRGNIIADVNKKIEESTEKRIKGTVTEAGIKKELLDLEIKAVDLGEDRLETVKKLIDKLKERSTGLGAELQKRLDSLEIEKKKLEVSRQQETRLLNQRKVLNQLKAEGASNLQLAIQELAFAERYNASFNTRLQLQKKINDLKTNVESQATKSLIDSQANLLKIQGVQEFAIIKQNLELEKKLGIERKGLDLLRQQLSLVQSVAREHKKSKEDRLNALEQEIRQQAKLQSPAYQARQEAREGRLRERAKELGIDADKFLSVPEIKDLPMELQRLLTDPMTDSMFRLTSAIESLTKEVVLQETKSIPLTGSQRSLAGRTTPTGQILTRPTRIAPTTPRTILASEPPQPHYEVKMGDTTLVLRGYLTPEELDQKIKEAQDTERDKTIKEYTRRINNPSSPEGKAVDKRINNF